MEAKAATSALPVVGAAPGDDAAGDDAAGDDDVDEDDDLDDELHAARVRPSATAATSGYRVCISLPTAAVRRRIQ
jgi:hypothetical protein